MSGGVLVSAGSRIFSTSFALIALNILESLALTIIARGLTSIVSNVTVNSGKLDIIPAGAFSY
jgi:hypothetical protein